MIFSIIDDDIDPIVPLLINEKLSNKLNNININNFIEDIDKIVDEYEYFNRYNISWNKISIKRINLIMAVFQNRRISS